MEIINKTKTSQKFGDVMVGDVFMYENEYYIKIDTVDSYTTKQLYGIRLDTGMRFKFLDTDNVDICNAQLYI